MLKSKKSYIYQTFLITLLVVLSLVIIMPFILLVMVSLSNEKELAINGYQFIPQSIDFAAYKYVFKNPGEILQAYKITAIFSFAAMVLSVFLMAMIAYPLSRNELKGRGKISIYLYFTMLFSGGLVPSYILMTQYLHLDDTIWIYILPGLISPWYVFMIRTFFQGIPKAMIESADIDGASELRIFLTMMLPLSKPVLAAVALFIFLGKWNDWMTSMLYINDKSLISLQYLLQRIMQNITLLKEATSQSGGLGLASAADIPSETVRMAMAVVVAGPALVVFPFFQKYFVKGLTVGSVKG